MLVLVRSLCTVVQALFLIGHPPDGRSHPWHVSSRTAHLRRYVMADHVINVVYKCLVVRFDVSLVTVMEKVILELPWWSPGQLLTTAWLGVGLLETLCLYHRVHYDDVMVHSAGNSVTWLDESGSGGDIQVKYSVFSGAFPLDLIEVVVLKHIYQCFVEGLPVTSWCNCVVLPVNVSHVEISSKDDWNVGVQAFQLLPKLVDRVRHTITGWAVVCTNENESRLASL